MKSNNPSSLPKNSKDENESEEFLCSICCSTLYKPVKINKCNHLFCKDCLKNYKNFQKQNSEKPNLFEYACPFCRTSFMQKNVCACPSLEKEINSRAKKCVCGKELSATAYKYHIEKCQKYKSTQIKAFVVPQKNEAGPNRDTFDCSVCQMRNFDRKGLIKHFEDFHMDSYAVCPICICQPWGDPDYKTYVYSHLTKRHMFDYDTTVDYNADEEEVLRRVLAQSVNDK